jgi:transmembrane sensor
MNKEEAAKLLHQYTEGNCTPEEKQLVEKYFLDFLDSQKQVPDPARMESDNLEMYNFIQAHIAKTNGASKVIKLWVWAAAASIILFLSVGAFLLTHTTQHIQLSGTHDIAPGNNSATLTLANGKTIVLNKTSNGQLAVQGNMAVTKTANGQLRYIAIAGASEGGLYNTITTKRKEQYDIVLCDGTHVWLDAASSIKYPTAFTGSDRSVETTGEAYFEVAHNAAKPFKVKSNGQIVEVLGTHFNINAYPDEPFVKTSLLEGSVKITQASSQLSKLLKPGQQALLAGNTIKVSNADTEADIAWKNGLFIFNDEPLESIMRKISRWYDVDINYDNIDRSQLFGGGITRFAKVSQVLKKLELTGGVHFKVEGRRITVTK